jgi:bifunctional DNA-binding transcriptional regulator/antitoxin component of YhaV-PrlF toxin-antitoxin module
MPSVTVTVRRKAGLVVPPSVQRKAGIKNGDRLEFKASRGLITIAAKSNGAEDKHTSDQRRMVDREIARGLEDIKRGRVHGPFSVSEATKFIKAELKTRIKKRKPK